MGPLSPDGKLILTYGYDEHNGEICLLDAETFEMVSYIPVLAGSAVNYHMGIDQALFSPDGKQLLVQLAEGVVYVYQITGEN